MIVVGATLLILGLLVMLAIVFFDGGGGAMMFGTVLVIFGMVLLLIGGAMADAKTQGAFMAQCLKDHKEYECTAMWRAGEDHTTVVPVPVIVR